ncbi:hypothetical protein T12_970, partial [Trichinella patagoniensis]
LCFTSFPLAPTIITLHSTFIAISRQIRVHTPCDQGFGKFQCKLTRTC